MLIKAGQMMPDRLQIVIHHQYISLPWQVPAGRPSVVYSNEGLVNLNLDLFQTPFNFDQFYFSIKKNIKEMISGILMNVYVLYIQGMLS